MSIERRWARNRTLLAGTSLSLTALIVTLFDLQLGWFQALLALIVVCLVPGYAVQEMLFVGHALPTAERLFISVVISLSVVILGGLILHQTPWGLQALSWVSYICVVTIVASAIAVTRNSLPVNKNPLPSLRPSIVVMSFTLLCSFVIVLMAMNNAVQGVAQAPVRAYTQLWLLPSGNGNSVTIGVVNFEQTEQTYRAILLSGGNLLKEWEDITLRHGETWEIVEQLPSKGDIQSLVEVQLFRPDEPLEIYRTAYFWR